MNIKEIEGLSEFIEEIFVLIEKKGLNVSKYNMDHVAYQASSSQDYENILKKLSEFGEVANEAVIGDRRVGIIKLFEPIKYKNNDIIALEVIEPKEGQTCKSGWEHTEFVVNEPYEALIKKYKDLDWDTSSMGRPIWSHLKLRLNDDSQIKFHKIDVIKSIEKAS